MSETDFEFRDIERLAALIDQADSLAVFTGAGMSTESGIPDFRSSGGLYAGRVTPEVFDLARFHQDPTKFYTFAREFFEEIRQARPNRGHEALARLERDVGKKVAIATQNIDPLHQRAGSTEVYPVHGTVETCTCLGCGDQQYTETIWDRVRQGRVPRHRVCGGIYKPDVVFFGECLPPLVFAGAEKAMQTADVVLVLGTSLKVYPAAELPAFRRAGTPLVIVNREPTKLDAEATLVFHASVGEILTATIDCLHV